jgi:hypothetical protein
MCSDTLWNRPCIRTICPYTIAPRLRRRVPTGHERIRDRPPQHRLSSRPREIRTSRWSLFLSVNVATPSQRNGTGNRVHLLFVAERALLRFVQNGRYCGPGASCAITRFIP